MNFAVVAFIGVTLGQPATGAASDYYPMNSRNIKIPIKYEKDRKAIRQVKLYVARNGENTWYQEGAVPPDRDFFTYVAKEDGVYWFTMVEEDLQGRNIPADLTRTQPDLKVVVDTLPPRVQFTNARRTGDEVVVEWFVDDKYPDETGTKVHFRAAGTDGYWQEVTLPAGSKTGVRFPAGTPGAVSVRVTAHDLAGNKTEAVRDITANAANSQTSTSLSPSLQTNTLAPPTGPASPPASPAAPPLSPAAPPTSPASAVASGGAGGSPLPPPDLGPAAPAAPPAGPASPVAPLAVTPTAPAAPVAMAPAAPPSPPAGGPAAPVAPPPSGVASAVVPVSPPAAAPVPAGPVAGNTAPPTAPLPGQSLPTVDPRQPVVQATPPTAGTTGGPSPVAVWTGGTAPTVPTVEVSRAQVINYLSFDMGYEVESRGPSGISRVDLWVTRDDGKTWLKWSQHDGKAATVRVNLNVPANPQPEGAYGFRVVPVSGAGLSEREPASGDAPDLRVVVDVTPPQLDLFPPTGDPTNPDTLVIQWKATDRNFGDDPITIEWSDKPTGPWQPAAAAGDVVQAAAGNVQQARKLPNTGQFAWRVPAGLPPRVYLKVSARDAAGNVREVVTRDPILVDLVKPKAKISGIVSPVGGIVRP